MMMLDVDPGIVVTDAAAAVSKEQPYADPSDADRATGSAGLARLVVGDLAGAAQVLASLGFTLTTDTDPVTGRGYALALAETGTERAWGLYLVDTSAPPRLCVAVPHPKFDGGTEQLAMRLWRALPGSVLAMATVHRRANEGAADPAHNTASLFHEFWTGVLGPRGIPQVQIHGFADDTAPEQVAVSTGAGPVHPVAERVAADIEAIRLRTTRSWDGTINPNLRAATNVQGLAAAAHDWIWLHIEHNHTVRADEALWHPAIDAVAAADPGLLALDRPSPGDAGHLPRPAGATSAAGTSRYLARADHVHPTGTRVRPVTMTVSEVVSGRSTLIIDASAGDHFRVELDSDTTLQAPTGETEGQQITVLAHAAHAVELAIDSEIHLCEGVGSPVRIPSGKHWFATLTHLGPPGWFLTSAARQR